MVLGPMVKNVVLQLGQQSNVLLELLELLDAKSIRFLYCTGHTAHI